MPEKVYTTPLLDKLGIKPGARVAVVNLDAPWFLDLLTDRTADVTMGSPLPDSDVIVVGADSLNDLFALQDLRARIRPNGGIWIVSRKGREATIRDTDVIAASLDAGLVDNKVVSFSETQTALRAVIRVRDRPTT
jgi:hypothetical protein